MCFLLLQCTYVSYLQFHSSSTRASPASRDLSSPRRVGPANAEANAPGNANKSRCTGPAGVGGGTTPGFSQIIIPRLLLSTGVALASDSRPSW